MRFTISSFLVTALSLVSCTVGPNYKEPTAPQQGRFRSTAPGATASPVDEADLQSWWRRFNDAQLSRLIAASTSNNLSVQAATANIKAARYQQTAIRRQLAPIVTSSGGYTNSRSPGAALPPGFPRDNESYDVGIDAAWELDFAGRIRRSVEVASADLAASEAVRDDLLVSVTAETALAYYELRGLQGQLLVANRNAENQRSTLDLTKKLLEGGRGTELDTARAQSQLSNTLSNIPLLTAAIDRSYHRLAVLTGQTPDSLHGSLAKGTLPTQLPTVRLGEPAALLRRRPDIRAAERQLAAATARIGVATAELFPRVSFGGSLGLSAASFSGLGNSGADRFGFGPSISWAFLDSPRRQQLVKAAGARTEGQLATYKQTVLAALEDTENALTDYAAEQARRTHLSDAVGASAKAAALARQRYDQGTAGFLEVLDAERVQLQNDAALAESQKRTLTQLIRLFKALGGGWAK